MKSAIVVIPCVAGLIIPSFDQQTPLKHLDQAVHNADDHLSSWWDQLQSSKDSVVSSASDAFDTVQDKAETVGDALYDEITDIVDSQDDIFSVFGGHEHSDRTIYELITESKHTSELTKLVNDNEDLVKRLNSTKGDNVTLFAPIDAAFDDIPDHHEKPDKETIEKVLLYHVGLGSYPSRKLLSTQTVPTAYDEEWLGGEPQRLRTSVGLLGVKVNFYSKVVAADIVAKNGIIHAVRSILVPPPMVGRELTLFPQYFSTLLLAYEKTDFVDFIHKVKMTGSTVFVPPNSAFAALGPKANAFLFNTEKGTEILRAVLKYHIVANATLYTDAFYDKRDDGKGDDVETEDTRHFDLETLLDGKRIGVDVARWWKAFSTIRVNGFVNVKVRDVVAKNGVMQVVDKVLVPPCKHHGSEANARYEATGEIDVEDLIERFEPYV